MTTLLITLSALLTFVLLFPLMGWIISRFLSRRPEPFNTRQHSYACLIPVYNNLELAQNCIQSLLNQTYRNFKIYVIVDGNKAPAAPSPTDRVVYLYPDQHLGSKHRSLHYALPFLTGNPDFVVIFDADNLAEPHYLETINRHITGETIAIQGRRIAKNLDTVYACLDAANEYYYNTFFREVPHRLGSSALTSGSGIAVDRDLFLRFFDFKPVRNQIDTVIHGEDKYLQAFIVKNGGRIKYTTKCTVYDEKITRGKEVSSQRARWLISYFKCLPYNLALIGEGIRHLSWTRLVFGLHASYPPIFLLLGVSLVLGWIMLLVLPLAGWFVIGGVFVLLGSFPLFLIASNAPRKVTLSLLAAPRFIFYQILAFFRIKKAYHKTLVTQNDRNISIEGVKVYEGVERRTRD